MGDDDILLTAGSTTSMAESCVLHVVPANGGGVDRYVRDICSLRPMDAILHVSPSQIVLESVRAHRFFPIIRTRETFAEIAKICGQPALLHAHSTLAPTREAVLELCRAWDCEYVLTLHDIDFDASDVADEEASERNAFVSRASHRIAPSEYIRDLSLRNKHLAPVVELIENGVDCLQSTGSASAVTPVPGQFQLAIVGALGEHKGLSFLRDVVASLPSDIRVVLVGYAEGQLGAGWMIEDRLWAHGAFESADLNSILGAYGCRLVLFPNRQPESFSYTLSDVWCAGRLALVPSIGALGERVSRHAGGWTYPAGATADVVVERIVHAIEDIAAGIAPAVPRVTFGVSDMVRRLQDIYGRVATHEVESPEWQRLQSLAASNLDGTFFRAELRRLSSDLKFSDELLSRQRDALSVLDEKYAGRGAWIAKLEGDIGTLQQEADVLRAAARAHAEAHQRDVEKLTNDVASTLAIAHHYERALAMIPGPLRNALLRRAKIKQEEVNKSSEGSVD